MNILVTLDSGYVKPLCVMLRSLFKSNPCEKFDIYVINKSLSDKDFEYIRCKTNISEHTVYDIKINDDMLAQAPVTDRYPHEMYYRIFAAQFLPENVDKILYLDPDLVVLKPLDSLYITELGSYFFAAASHVNKTLQKINDIRLQMETKGPYINSGVMLMNIKLLREQQDFSKVFEYIEKNLFEFDFDYLNKAEIKYGEEKFVFENKQKKYYLNKKPISDSGFFEFEKELEKVLLNSETKNKQGSKILDIKVVLKENGVREYEIYKTENNKFILCENDFICYLVEKSVDDFISYL